MKKLTLELYDKIIDKVYDESNKYPKMLNGMSRDVLIEYIGFYAYHGGLFWSEQDGEVCGAATFHPGKRDFNWKWTEPDGDWTNHVFWGFGQKSKADILRAFFKQQTIPVRLWAVRRGAIVEIGRKKLERIFSYGIWRK